MVETEEDRGCLKFIIVRSRRSGLRNGFIGSLYPVVTLEGIPSPLLIVVIIGR